jgi:RNA polymerase sigma factor for flagellar operon FliA
MQATRDQLIRDHADIARRIALKMARRCPDWVAREDLISAGMLGLIEAADRYDGAREEPFVSFAEHRIRGAVLDELRRGDIMPRRVRQLARKIVNAMRELEKTGELATDQRIADTIGVPVERYRDNLAQLAHVTVASIDDHAHLAANDGAPDVQAAHRERLGKVREALARLDARDVTILSLHYIEDMTYQQIAAIVNVTPSRVCQLLWRAVERLRGKIETTQMLQRVA